MRSRQDIKIYVEELIIAESGTYGDQFLRPYKAEITGGLLDRIDERFRKANRFTSSILAEIANQFMVPDMHPRGVIEIPNGWHERRGRFILTLEIHIGTGDRLKQVVMGYTNSVGFTTRNVDPDMEFYINNTFLLTSRQIRTDRGFREVFVPTHTNDVLSDRDNGGLRRRGPEMYTLRPEDVYSALDAEQTIELVQDVTDLRTTLSKNAIKSSTSNRLGSRYMANVLTGRQKALENMEYGNAAADINATAQGYVQESYTSDDVFLRAMSNIRGLTTTVDNFTFEDLEKLDPNVENRTETKLLDDLTRSRSYYDTDEIKPNDGQEEEDRIAALIAIAVPALMMETGLHQIRFQIHNQGHEPGFEFIPTEGKSFVKDVDLASFMEKFEERIIDELLYPITGDDRYDIGIQVTCRVFGEIDFTLFYDGKNHGRYVFPCFCNSLSSPIVTDDREDIRSISRHFNDLFDEFLPSDSVGGGAKSGRNFGY